MRKALIIISMCLMASIACLAKASAETNTNETAPYSGRIGELILILHFENDYIEATTMDVGTRYEAIQLEFSSYDETSNIITLHSLIDGITVWIDLPRGVAPADAITVQMQSNNELYNGKATLKILSDYQIADEELNYVYQAVKEKYKDDTSFLQKLKESQLLWIKFRDAEVAMRYPATDKLTTYGSVYPVCVEALLTELTETRTTTLWQWLDGAAEGEVCSGSIELSM